MTHIDDDAQKHIEQFNEKKGYQMLHEAREELAQEKDVYSFSNFNEFKLAYPSSLTSAADLIHHPGILTSKQINEILAACFKDVAMTKQLFDWFSLHLKTSVTSVKLAAPASHGVVEFFLDISNRYHRKTPGVSRFPRNSMLLVEQGCAATGVLSFVGVMRQAA